jgi:hypothetical protein
MITLKVLEKFPKFTYVISSEPRSSDREIPVMIVSRAPSMHQNPPLDVMLNEVKHLVLRTEGKAQQI